jgi:hypothetical protein
MSWIDVPLFVVVNGRRPFPDKAERGRQELKKILITTMIFICILATMLAIGEIPLSAAPELPTTWYFAEGTTREGFFEWLSIQNPGADEAEVSITYMTNEGEVGPFVMMVPPVSRDTVLVNEQLDAGLDVSVKVESDKGVVVERPMYFTYKDKWEGGHVVMGVNQPSKEWYFAEGTTRPGFEEWLCIQNPQTDSQQVKVTYYAGLEVHEEIYAVSAQHRFTIDVNTEIARLWQDEPHQDVSIKVEAPSGIIAERPMYFAYKGDWEGGHIVMGQTLPGKEWYLAEGYCQWNSETWLCILNPDLSPANVTIDYRRKDGAPLPPHDMLIPGLSRQTVYVNSVAGQGEFSFQITSDTDIVVERPMYFDYNYVWPGGHDNMAVSRAAAEWYLAEGATWHGIETYLCILNPLPEDQDVIVQYLMEGSEYKEVEFTVAANSRYTRNVNNDVGENHNVSFRVNAFKQTELVEPGEIIVERPMYFLYGGIFPGGHVASGFAE